MLEQYTWRRTAEGYLRALAGRNHDVDAPTRELRASSGIASSPEVEALAPTADGRLPIHAYFSDPRAEHAITPDELGTIRIEREGQGAVQPEKREEAPAVREPVATKK